MRSFSNLWYWIGLAVLWSSMSYWVIGIPFDLIMRARRQKAGAMQDLHAIARVNVNRIQFIFDTSGTLIALFGATAMTALFLSGFVYSIEFSQAVFLLIAPVMLVVALSLRTARRITREGLQEDALIRRLLVHRFITQMIGVFAIFVTAMYGMYKNLYVGPLGGF